MGKAKRLRHKKDTFDEDRVMEVETINKMDEQLVKNPNLRCDEDEDVDHREVFCKDTSMNKMITSFLTKQLIFCRVFLLIFQCVINYIMKDYPTDAFRGIPRESSCQDQWVQNIFGGLSRWDARHFLHIAEFGYTWESSLAFFPLFPALLRIIGGIVRYIFPTMDLFSSMILGGVILNNTIFVANGLLLYRLILLITEDLKVAIIAVYVFCWNPASIFFSAVYTESLYMLFTLLALTVLYRVTERRENLFLSSFIFAFALLTRSNGVTNVGYIAFHLMLEVILTSRSSKVSFAALNFSFLLKVLKNFSTLVACFFIIVLPFRVFEFMVKDKFCTTTPVYMDKRLLDFIANNSVVLPGDLENLTWCREENTPFQLLPSYYANVQKVYWNVGLFGYWKLRKVPLFLIASPTLLFVFYGFGELIKSLIGEGRSFENQLANRRLLIPFAVQSLVIAIAGLFIYNVESSTRLLFSSSPFIYLVIARVISKQTPNIVVPDDMFEPFILPFLSIYARVRFSHFMMLSYLLGYFFIGTLMHVNWLPFV